MACILMANLMGLAGPAVLRYAIDDLTAGVTQRKMLRYSGMILLVAIIQGIFLFFQRRIINVVSRHVEYNLSNDFYAHLQRLSLEFYERHRTGDLMSRATSDLSAVRMIVAGTIMYSVNTIIATALILPLMATIDWRLTIISFLAMPLVILATKIVSKQVHDESQKVQEHFGVISGRVQESLAGVRVIRAYAQERDETLHFRRLNRGLVRRNMRLIHLTSLFTPLLRFFIGLGFLAVFWYGGRLTIVGVISVGQFFQATLYLRRLIFPMLEFGWVINLFQRGMASMGRMHEVLSIEPANADRSEHSRLTEIKGDIEFRHLTFTHQGGSQPVLKDINLRIGSGQVVAVVGGVGSGKSTLLNLVPRLLEAGPGEVLIDGHPIHEIPLKTLRAAISYVPQETFLFSETIRENIAFGAIEATAEEVERAAFEAGIAEEISEFSKGYETLLGERGVTLSGGQKQRTAIARALIRQPRVLLLDDCLSSVDTQTEEEILNHLRRLMRGRTCLIVSHRISTVRDADLIVVLAEGRIAERGTHDELIRSGGLYAQLYEKQLLEEELATLKV